MRKALHNTRGETIVEILVSFLMLLIFISAFVMALRGANRMMTRANQIRKEAYQLTQALYPYNAAPPKATTGDSYTYTFVQKDLQGMGFSISGQLGSIETQSGDTTHNFPQYVRGEG